jgi:deazaflavin-dependent oxidoreductase (nitroreductase family)
VSGRADDDKRLLVFVRFATRYRFVDVTNSPPDQLAPQPVSHLRARTTDDSGKVRRPSARLAGFVERYLLNPQMRLGLALGLAPRAFALLETSGRRTGKPRRTPVGNGLIGDTFWLVSEHGRGAGYVRNIEANPRVRVKIGRGWRTGSAHVLPDDDAAARLALVASRLGRMRRLDAAIFRAFVRWLGTEPVTIRIDLDPASRCGSIRMRGANDQPVSR